MPSVILIGGIARVGKTTLVNRLLKKLPYYTLSTDNLKTMGQKFNVMVDESSSKDWSDPKKWLEPIRSRDYEIWQWTKEYIISAIKENQSIIVEGNLWPDYICEDIKQFAKCNKYRSEKLKELAKEHNSMVYDIAAFNTKTEMQDAIEKLILGEICKIC